MLGEYTCQSGDVVDAVAYFRQVMLFDEEALQAHVSLIRALTKNGQMAEAEYHLEHIKIKDSVLAGLIAEIVNEGSV